MKRIISCFLCLAGLSFMISGCGTPSFPQNDGVVISGTFVENDFHNYCAGSNLVRIGDKLYLNYPKSEWCYGVIELSKDGANPIISPKSSTLVKYPTQFYLRNYQGRLIVFESTGLPDSGTLQQYSFQTHQLEAVEEIDGGLLQSNRYQRQGDVVVQTFIEPTSDTQKLYWYYKNESGVLSRDVDYFYVSDNNVYYATFYRTDTVQRTDVYRFDCKTQTDEWVCSLDQTVVWAFMVIEDKIVVNTAQYGHSDKRAVQILDISHRPCEVVHTIALDHTYRYSMNAYERVLYLPHDNGVDTYDMKTNERKVLVEDTRIDECYIFDDTWVYLIQYDEQDRNPSKLYRVKQDGTCLEKVYGF